MRSRLGHFILTLSIIGSSSASFGKAVTTLRDSIMATPGALTKPSLPEQASIRKRFDPTTRLAGGVWNGGGGGGIACFKDIETAKNALDQTGRFKDGAIATIESLSTNEYYMAKYLMEASGPRYKTYVDELFKPRESEDAAQFLERVLVENYNSISPLFVEYVLTALAWVRPSEWNPMEQMPTVKDTGPIDFRSNCQYVQLFTRFQKSQPGNLPVGFIDADQVLWTKMSALHGRQYTVLNQAIGMLHEALYLLGTELNHKTSGQTQALTLILMSQNFATYVREEHRPDTLYVQLADFGFHHFANILTPLYLKKLEEIASPKSKFTKATRFQSYANLKLKLDALPVPEDLRKDPQDPIANAKFMNINMPAFFASEKVTVEEAFIGASFFESVPPQKIPNPEVLVSLQFDDELYLKVICNDLRDQEARNREPFAGQRQKQFVEQARVARLAHVTKALKYCQAIGH